MTRAKTKLFRAARHVSVKGSSGSNHRLRLRPPLSTTARPRQQHPGRHFLSRGAAYEVPGSETVGLPRLDVVVTAGPLPLSTLLECGSKGSEKNGDPLIIASAFFGSFHPTIRFCPTRHAMREIPNDVCFRAYLPFCTRRPLMALTAKAVSHSAPPLSPAAAATEAKHITHSTHCDAPRLRSPMAK